MHKLKTFLFFGIISLLSLVMQFVWHINLPYTLAGFRIRTEADSFLVTDCFPSGPAYKAGIRVGDSIIRLNDINIKEFAEKYMDAPFEDAYTHYADLYKIGETYTVECSNGYECTFTISDDMPFFDRLRCISLDNWTTFSTGLIFVLFGIVTSFFVVNVAGTSDFVWFMLAMGPCISNGYTEAANSLAYTIYSLVTFDISTALVSFAILRSIAYFFMLAEKDKKYFLFRKISIVPIFISLTKFALITSGISSIFDEIFVNMPILLLSLSFVILLILFIILMRKVKQQLSVILRFFFLGITFSTIVPAITLITHVVVGAFWVSNEYETLYTILPLSFIPYSIFCALFQTASIKYDDISCKLMTGGCTAVIISMLTFFFKGTVVEMIFLACLMVAIFIGLEKPVDSFLFPKVKNVKDELLDLERKTGSLQSMKETFETCSSWIERLITPGFVIFCMFSDNRKELNVVYPIIGEQQLQNDMLSDMIAERLAQKEDETKIMIHRQMGFSVPMYLNQNISGYIFIGQKSKYSIFSNEEMFLVESVSQIIKVSTMFLEITRKSMIVADMQNRVVYSFADMIESRDGTTGQHVKRTNQIVELIMKKIQENKMYGNELDDIDCEMIKQASTLHDIGKIKVPDAILSKPGKLTEEEFAIIKTHPVEGERIISKTMSGIENERYLRFAKDMALYHHEKWNGEGYPYGLSGKEIPICARIMTVADVFDALCSERSYKKAYPIDRAFEILEESKGSHFEPCLVDLMYEIRKDLEEIYKNNDAA